MKAATCRSYGSPHVLQIEDLPQPLPRRNEVLVEVRASTVTSGDVRLRACTGAGIFWVPLRLVFGVLRPRNPITGMEFAGVVAEVGAQVTKFRVGDKVFGMKIGGANADYLTIRETGAIVTKPEELSFEEAAALPFGALSAFAFLCDFARLQSGQKILVHGASGAVGVFAVQLAKHFGAHVSGVCSTANVDLVKILGADVVIDYTTTDFTKGSELYDIILDTVGGTSFSRIQHVLTPNGRHVFMVQKLPQLLQALWTSMRRGKRVIVGMSGDSQSDLLVIKKLIQAGTITPVIDRIFDLSEIADAHAYVDTGRKRGAIIVTVGRNRAGYAGVRLGTGQFSRC